MNFRGFRDWSCSGERLTRSVTSSKLRWSVLPYAPVAANPWMLQSMLGKSAKASLPTRRSLLQWAAGLLPAAGSTGARASTYPSRQMRLIVGFPPGGASDILARVMACRLSERMGQPVIVENMPGAGTGLATHAIFNFPPDGHTLLLVGSSTVASALFHERDQPTFLADLMPTASLTTSAFAIAVNSSNSRPTLAGLVADAKARPGALNMGTYGAGTQSHLAALSFCRAAGIEVTLVPYRGSAPLINDLLGQHIQVAVDAIGNVLPHIKSGALTALAVTTAKPFARFLPGVPVTADLLPGYEMTVWTGLAVRRGTPLDIVERLHHECTASLSEPTVRAKLADLAWDIMPSSRDDFVAFWSDAIRRTRKIIVENG